MVILCPTTTVLPSAPNSEELGLWFFSPKYNSAFFTADIFLFMGIILRGPECLHHGCEGELSIHCFPLSFKRDAVAAK